MAQYNFQLKRIFGLISLYYILISYEAITNEAID